MDKRLEILQMDQKHGVEHGIDRCKWVGELACRKVVPMEGSGAVPCWEQRNAGRSNQWRGDCVKQVRLLPGQLDRPTGLQATLLAQPVGHLGLDVRPGPVRIEKVLGQGLPPQQPGAGVEPLPRSDRGLCVLPQHSGVMQVDANVGDDEVTVGAGLGNGGRERGGARMGDEHEVHGEAGSAGRRLCTGRPFADAPLAPFAAGVLLTPDIKVRLQQTLQ
mmetsp:Transcript_43948/g.78952  ORF Transcript_43948/g.78952 Transcript_43948/m.78952 type:complete len:218 (+) Transcript_43948:1240-1893(+)